MLVAELALHAQPQRRAMRLSEGRAVHVVGEDRLRVEGVDEVDALIIFSIAAERVGAMEDEIAGVGLETHTLQQRCKLRAAPLADRAPALDAVVARDLRARGKLAQLGEAELGRATSPPILSFQSAKPA